MLFEIQRKGKTSPKPVKTSSLTNEGWNEKDLENYLRDNLPKLISDDLMVIGQSRPYQPEADLIALDRQGDLWIFELKKVATSSDNLLQVMRYSQNAANFSVDDLSDLYLAYKGGRSDSLVVDFCKHFGFVSPTAAQQWSDALARNHHLVVVAEGTDEEAIQSVGHWQRTGVDIQLWPYRIHGGDDNAFQFELPDLFIKGRQISRGRAGYFLSKYRQKKSVDFRARRIHVAARVRFGNGRAVALQNQPGAYWLARSSLRKSVWHYCHRNRDGGEAKH